MPTHLDVSLVLGKDVVKMVTAAKDHFTGYTIPVLLRWEDQSVQIHTTSRRVLERVGQYGPTLTALMLRQVLKKMKENGTGYLVLYDGEDTALTFASSTSRDEESMITVAVG